MDGLDVPDVAEAVCRKRASMMKVLVYTSLYPNNVWTHHGVFVKERMTQFAKETGAQVRVVAPVPYFPSIALGPWSGFSQVLRRETIEGIEVHHPRYLLIPKISMMLHGLLMAVAAVPLLRRLRRESTFDVIDAHFVYPDGFAAVLLGMWFGKPVVVSARGSDINVYKDIPIIRSLLVFTLRRAQAVIAVSQALKDAIVSLGTKAEKVRVIPNGVDPGKFRPLEKVDARRQVGLPDRSIILSVGNITPVKGFDLLIKSVKVLIEQHGRTDVLLVIAGEGAHRTELESLVAELGLDAHVRFVGDVQHERLFLWYGAADLCCLASVREGWPNVVVEALACGRPVIGTKVGGIPEILTTEEVGILTDRDEHSLADALRRGLDRPWSVDAILGHARSFSWAEVAHSVFDVATDVVACAGGTAAEGRSETALIRDKVKS